MGLLKGFLILGLASAIGLGFWCSQCCSKIEIPPLDEDAFWTKERPKVQDTKIRPFKIQATDEHLDDLLERLETAREPFASLQGINFEYGVNNAFMEKVQKFWINEYKWKEREAVINELPQFLTCIEGLDIHFIHIKPPKENKKTVVPLLLLHGWPGSFVEFMKIIPMLSKPKEGKNFVFELVIPSLPGYGFSHAARKPGLGPLQVAQIMRKLMVRLGHEKFFVQGGDWGSVIATFMGILYPERVTGLHLNMCFANSIGTRTKLVLGSFWPSLFMSDEEASKIYPLGDLFKFVMREMGYMHLQATKPDTVGVALNDSPIGLAAYILEKFSTWTNRNWISSPDGGLPGPYTMTELLDNVMVYYLSGTITSSMRLYSEMYSEKNRQRTLDTIPVKVPTGCAMFPNELVVQPESFVRDRYPNMVSFTHMSKGGHFAAMEQPELLAQDIWSVVGLIQGSLDN